jgi:hypothetical protein
MRRLVSLPDALRVLRLRGGPPALATVANEYAHRHLTHLELSNLGSLESIGDGFATAAPHLQDVTIASLPRLSRIGARFAVGASQLKHVRLNALPVLTSVGDDFAMSSSVTKLDLSSHVCPQLATLGAGFAADCRYLVSLNVSGLRSLTRIQDRFAFAATALKELDLSGLSGVGWIHDDFLAGCTRLPRLDLSGMPGLVSVGHSAGLGCSSLAAVVLPSGVVEVDRMLFANCHALTAFPVDSLAHVTKLGPRCLLESPARRRPEVAAFLARHGQRVHVRKADGCSVA